MNIIAIDPNIPFEPPPSNPEPDVPFMPPVPNIEPDVPGNPSPDNVPDLPDRPQEEPQLPEPDRLLGNDFAQAVIPEDPTIPDPNGDTPRPREDDSIDDPDPQEPPIEEPDPVDPPVEEPPPGWGA